MANGQHTHHMDKDEVCVGDTMHDVAFGHGTVVELWAGGVFLVEFAVSRRKLPYTAAGKTEMFSQRTLFWQQPFIHAPRKPDTATHQRQHSTYTRIARAVSAEVNKLSEG